MKQILSFVILLLSIDFLNAQDVTFNASTTCNGAATSGTWTVPCGVTSITVEVYGGGGGGGGGGDGSNGGVFCGNNRGGGGGGGGAYSSRTINVTPGTSFTYAVGSGGCGGAVGGEGDDGNHGGNGGNSTFVGTDATSTPINMAANGGQGGRRGNSCSSVGGPSTGGTASGGTTNTPGTGGSGAQPAGSRIGGVGGAGAGPLGGAGGTATVNSSVPGSVRGGGGGGGGDSNGGRGAEGILFITYNTPVVLPATPTTTSTPATCAAAGSTAISNYDPAMTYTFTPAGPSAGAGGAITGMTTGTSYTVIAGQGGCNSTPSAAFSNAAQVAPPATPTVTTTPPSCSGNGVSTITNYNAALIYTFVPAGPTAGAGGVISGMTVGTSYTVDASDGTCNAPAPSAAFSIAAQLPTPATPTTTTTPPTCSSAGSSVVSNYNAALTYIFTPAGPTVGAGGAITGMTTGTNYTLEANDGTCNSTASASFSNAAQVAAPAVPTIATTPPSCSADGSSTISNYNAALTYIFNPVGPTVGAGGAITGMTTGTSYTVESSDGACNSVSPSAAFSNAAQFPTPVAAINGSLSYCTGGNTTLTASGGTGYVWTDAGSNNIGSTANVTVTQGSYTVVVTDANGCTASANATVTEATSLTVVIGGTLSYCPGGNTTITANGGTSFVWNDAGNSTTASITVTAGTYSVTASDASGCTGTNSATVTEFAAPVAAIGGALSYCVGANTTLTATGGASYAWNDAGSSTTDVITVTQGNYTVTVTDANTCTATATANVTESAPPAIAISGALGYCPGGSTTITASGGVSYVWSNSETNAATTVTQGTYTVTVTDALGCTNTESATVTESPSVTADFSFQPKCAGEDVQFQNLSVGATDYVWNFGNGSTSTDASPTFAYNAGGSFTVTLTATAANCSDVATQTIVISEKPVASFTATQLNLIQNETALEITNNSTGATAWFWTFGDSAVSGDFEPVHYYAQKGVYDVSLVAIGAGGCSDTLTKSAWVTVVEKPALYIPNLFSPNNDGVNDFFKIEGGGFKQVDLKIFNRWGEKVFETDNAKIGWDGYVGGEKAQPGVYVYHLTVLYEILTTTQHTGSILLVR